MNHHLAQEQGTDLRSKTKNSFFIRRTENRSTANQFLLLFRTCNPRPPTPAFLTTHNLHLGTCNCSFRRTENRSTTNQFLLLFRTPYLLTPTPIVLKAQIPDQVRDDGFCSFRNTACRHSDNAPSQNLDLLVRQKLGTDRFIVVCPPQYCFLFM